ncbi:MAG: alginate export family protein [Gammaproteobacteria bacterium]
MHRTARSAQAGTRRAGLSDWVLLYTLGLVHPAGPAYAVDAASPSTEAEEVDEDALRERLTEREDKRRPLVPWSIEIAGRPLTFSGEYELSPAYVRRRVLGEAVEEPDRLLFEQGIEAEAFYTFGPALSVFAQLRAGMEEDLLPDSFEAVSDLFVERGEMWLYSEDLFGSHLNLDLGRLHFEDERRFWWDEELDAVRLAYEGPKVDIALALAWELGPNRSDRILVDPEQDEVLRLIGEASWDLVAHHTLELFLLHQDDQSPAERPEAAGQDATDAWLTWFGVRFLGAFDLGHSGLLGYWLDTARVGGEERLSGLPEDGAVITGPVRRDVSGWAVDAGVNWILPLDWEPRLYAGYARGSGDPTPETGSDRSFRQTGLEANEAGFGSVERFPHFGVLLDPELSNLGVVTAGAGLSLLRSSSLDLVYHNYRLVEPASSLRNARLEVALTGRHRGLGEEIDLVLALEEWDRFEFDLIGSAFRAGRAFGETRDEWSYAAFLAMKVAF